nr:hypothetical protein [uncultured Bacteroides sp.]
MLWPDYQAVMELDVKQGKTFGHFPSQAIILNGGPELAGGVIMNKNHTRS